MTSPRDPVLAIAAALVVLFAAGYSTLSDPVGAYPLLMALCAVGSLGWLLGTLRARTVGPAGIRLVLGVALVARLLAVVPFVPLSDDLYRYLWDGRVANAGVDPFAHAPSAPELEPLRDDRVWPNVNHPDVPTIYPPIAQLGFRLLDLVAPVPRSPRAVAALLDFATVLLVGALLRRRGAPAGMVALVAWCPLAILETGGGGHVDALGAVLLVASFVAAGPGPRREALAGFLFGASALAKPVAPFLLPAVLGPRTSRQRVAFLAGAATALLLVVPYLGAGTKLLTGFTTYAEHWRFHDAVYSPLVSLGLGPRAARGVLAGLLVAAALLVPRRVRDPLAASGTVIAVLLLLSPTVHPWYALWLVPFLPFLPRALRAGAVTFVLLLPVVYASGWYLATRGAWAEPGWAKALGWLPALLVTGLGLGRAARPGAPREAG